MDPILYIDKEELKEFYSIIPSDQVGVYYEWEGENVVHLCLKQKKHSFGKTGKVQFSNVSPSEYSGQLSDKDYFVKVYSDSGEIVSDVYLKKDSDWIKCEINYIPSKEDLYSRNKGILEINILENKRVMVVGLGSFGSNIAIELAKAGVGSFALFDFDRVELHNLARHTCTTNDLGSLKTDAIEDAIKGKNPYATVDKFPIDINNDIKLLESEIRKADIVICATDNNKSRFNISTALVKLSKTGIFGRAVTRAEGGDVFRYRPGGPCYCCLIGAGFFDSTQEEITDVQSARRDGRIAAYVSSEDANAMVQVGLSADIEPICNLMVKLTLVELSKGAESGISCLESELVYDYYMWANRRERRHANWAPLPNAANRPSILRWYGARIPRNESCPLCSNAEIQLDEGEEFEQMLDNNDLSDIDIDKL
jgi:molybdopterin/thiamine biosynthesis adenylyltransferase